MKANHRIVAGQDSVVGGPFLVKSKEACKLLGGIHPRSLARLEERGLIRSVKLFRHKMYAPADIEALVAELRKWKAEVAQ